jgi:hypothetical protein
VSAIWERGKSVDPAPRGGGPSVPPRESTPFMDLDFEGAGRQPNRIAVEIETSL